MWDSADRFSALHDDAVDDETIMPVANLKLGAVRHKGSTILALPMTDRGRLDYHPRIRQQGQVPSDYEGFYFVVALGCYQCPINPFVARFELRTIQMESRIKFDRDDEQDDQNEEGLYLLGGVDVVPNPSAPSDSYVSILHLLDELAGWGESEL